MGRKAVPIASHRSAPAATVCPVSQSPLNRSTDDTCVDAQEVPFDPVPMHPPNPSSLPLMPSPFGIKPVIGYEKGGRDGRLRTKDASRWRETIGLDRGTEMRAGTSHHPPLIRPNHTQTGNTQETLSPSRVKPTRRLRSPCPADPPIWLIMHRLVETGETHLRTHNDRDSDCAQ
eukprot:1189297-Prorocentrum_minimum.AAC.4